MASFPPSAVQLAQTKAHRFSSMTGLNSINCKTSLLSLSDTKNIRMGSGGRHIERQANLGVDKAPFLVLLVTHTFSSASDSMDAVSF